MMYFDPARWWWPENTPLVDYSARFGRSWLNICKGSLCLDFIEMEECDHCQCDAKWSTVGHKPKSQS